MLIFHKNVNGKPKGEVKASDWQRGREGASFHCVETQTALVQQSSAGERVGATYFGVYMDTVI